MSFELASEIDAYETRIGSDGSTIEVREFRQLELTKTITSYEKPNEAFTTKGVISFLYNGSLNVKSLTNPKKFLCTQDSIIRDEIPGNGSRRAQTWVYYSQWIPTTAFGG